MGRRSRDARLQCFEVEADGQIAVRVGERVLGRDGAVDRVAAAALQHQEGRVGRRGVAFARRRLARRRAAAADHAHAVAARRRGRHERLRDASGAFAREQVAGPVGFLLRVLADPLDGQVLELREPPP